jgi:cob(I)alamin adenosyltransferase
MKIYTCEGDDGTTSLSGGKRLSKSHPRIDAVGTIDELISWIGLLKDQKENKARRDILHFIQEILMESTFSLASDPENLAARFVPDKDCVAKLESEIDDAENKLTPLNSFLVPGGNQAVSYCHIARCVCRRAERTVIFLRDKEFVPEIIVKFLNRLSDYLFVLSRIICLELDIEEDKWHL